VRLSGVLVNRGGRGGARGGAVTLDRGGGVHRGGRGGARGGGVAVHRGSGVAVHRGGRGVVVHRGGGRGGARGCPRLSGLAPGVVSRHMLGRLGPALAPALSVGRGSDSGRALSGGTNELLATSLHDTGKGRAGKSQNSNGVDHFERSKS
jgi:hypothetical protein